MIAELEVHHAAPRCLLRLLDAAGDDRRHPAWLEFELEAERWSVPVSIGREDLEELVEHSTEVLEREKHRLLHEGDFVRWGRRGGLTVLRRYGTDWFAALALRRWGRISADDLDAMRGVLR